MAANGQVTARRKPIVTSVPLEKAADRRQPSEPAVKPTPAGLGVDLAALDWQRSGAGPGSFEVAFVADAPAPGGAVPSGGGPGSGGGPDRPADWVLLRVAGDPDGRVLVYDRNEWTCFLDGAERGEFDWPEELMRATGA